MKTALLVSLVCLSLILSVQSSSAEWFGDVYVGATLTNKDDIKVRSEGPGHATYRDVEFDTGLAYGGRFGRYFDAVPFLGLGVDYFNFMPNISAQDVRVDGCPLSSCVTNTKISFGSYDISAIALSLDVFLRLPLFRSETAPGGRVQPYLLAGAPLFITSFTPRNSNLFRNADGDTDLSFGYKGGAGVAVYVFRNLMVFGEYRYTHVEHEFQIRDINANKATLRTELNSHTGLIGLGARW